MAYIIPGILITVFSVIGIIESVKQIIFRLFRPDTSEKIMLIAQNDCETEKLEYNLRNFADKIRWLSNIAPQRVIYLINSPTTESRTIAELISKEYEFLEVMTTEELSTELTKENNYLQKNTK